MKNVFKWNSNFILIITLISMNSFSQEIVVWDAIPNNTIGITGNCSAGIVTASAIGIGSTLLFRNIGASDFNSFWTDGPRINDPAQNIIFNFPVPVVITNFTVTDINFNTSPSIGWDDSFQLTDVLFSNVTAIGSNPVLLCYYHWCECLDGYRQNASCNLVMFEFY